MNNTEQARTETLHLSADTVALVTGSSRGIGRSIARALAQAGARVIITARSEKELQEAAFELIELNAEVLSIPGDVTRPSDVRRIIASIIAMYGRLDVLVNNAGRLAAVGPIWEVDPDSWWREIEVNLRGAHLYAHYALPFMIARRSGRIINIAGGGDAYMSAYAISKRSLMHLTKLIHVEAGSLGIHAFDVFPGPVDTQLARDFAASSATKRWKREMLASTMNKVAPEHAARLVVEIACGLHDERSGQLLQAQSPVPPL